ncbi:hypothetical protein L873DRAFT_1810065 [Choiromyces venosus 120613-1]|uniref:Uncharacterized protein n=1 Tax=Choiromyces venosus 120613-1 TaxID=1336337 RepID=A0A3N4JG50_9PEZI|nr:hypothetical protein L873DRAFT_1824618 [Choiromyces venosus 120613-1]RPA97252.1 hypothetical protein L873DRAFT_1810065 [Choiromyces venosus 120613-1]
MVLREKRKKEKKIILRIQTFPYDSSFALQFHLTFFFSLSLHVSCCVRGVLLPNAN